MRDDLTGLTIIADLARGGSISLRAARDLSDAQDYQRALAKIVRNDSACWPGLILSHVREAVHCKNDVMARALLLCIGMLHAGTDAANDDMLAEYAARLRLCSLDIESTSANGALRRKIMEALAQVPPGIARRVLHPRFLR